MKIDGLQISNYKQGFGRILGLCTVAINGGILIELLPYSEENGVVRKTWSLFTIRLDINSRYCILWFDFFYFKFGGYQLFEPYYKRKFDAEIKEFTKNWPDDDIPF